MRKTAVALALIGFAALARAQESKPEFTFALHGFVSASFYAQDQYTGVSEGQQSLWAGTPQVVRDKLFLGGDVRQSRFNFSVTGPKVMGATPKGVLEIDWFGGFGSGNYGDVSLVPRMRAAYAELDFGSTRLDFGQQNDLIFAIAPTSLSHIAFPFGYAAGNIGWRRPAIWGFHKFGFGEFAWEVGRAQWADQGAVQGSPAANQIAWNGIGQNTTAQGGGVSLGEASGLPAVEARLTLAQGTSYSFFVTGHWNKVDKNGVNEVGGATWDVIAGNLGGKVVAGPLTIAATAFTGKNLAPLIGNFLTFQPLAMGDVHEWGAWGQLGLNFTKQLSIWAFMGTDHPNEENAIRANSLIPASTTPGGTNGPATSVKTRNVTTAAMLQYREGGFAHGLEWIHFQTRYHITAGGAIENRKADQFIYSANYFF